MPSVWRPRLEMNVRAAEGLEVPSKGSGRGRAGTLLSVFCFVLCIRDRSCAAAARPCSTRYSYSKPSNVYNTAPMTTSVPVTSTREKNGIASTECIKQARHHRRRPRHTRYFLSNPCRDPLTFRLITLLPIALGTLDPPPPRYSGWPKARQSVPEIFPVWGRDVHPLGTTTPFRKYAGLDMPARQEFMAAATRVDRAREAPASEIQRLKQHCPV